MEFFGSWLTICIVPVALRRRVAPGLPFSDVLQKKTPECVLCVAHIRQLADCLRSPYSFASPGRPGFAFNYSIVNMTKFRT